jgi:Protein of unknown function (DUF3054)
MRHTQAARQTRTSKWYRRDGRVHGSLEPPTASPRTRPRRQRLWGQPPVLDAAALVAFAAVGMLAHDRALFLSGFLRDALPLLGAWFAVAFALGTYRRQSLRRLLLTWAIAVPLAVVVRAVALGRHADAMQAAFLATSMAFTLLLVLGFRALFARTW